MNWYVKRTAQALFTIFVVVNFSFGLIRLLPGGPMAYLQSQLFAAGTDANRQVELAEQYLAVNPEEPITSQYLDYVSSLLQGDLGTSIWYNEPVTSILVNALPWTVFVMAISMLFICSISVVLGAFMAYSEGSRFDVSATIISVVSMGVPYYIVAVILVYFLGYQGGYFPTGGRMDQTTTVGFNGPFLVGVLYHAALPALSFIIAGTGRWALNMRGNSIRVLGEDYLRVARLRGLKRERIALRYVGRNSILPMYTGLMITLGFYFGGSVILEQVFKYYGVGYYMYQALSARDYPLMMGAFMIITVAVVVAIYVSDLTYGLLDPRARRGENSETY